MMWEDCMKMLRDNPRWVLDNLENLSTFKVSWNTYSRGRCRKVQCGECLAFNHVDLDYCKKCKCQLKNRKIHSFGVGKPPESAVI
tara:strand:- start:137 stop:391 length:255 start_codon:yes stop_codon:yes gene_type:complete